jgi:hypothetical protein
MQNSDGGWSQLPTRGSDADATGQAIYALYQSGMLPTEDESYQKGLRYLLKTQDESGAWIVEIRSYPIQPSSPLTSFLTMKVNTYPLLLPIGR